MPQKLTWDSAAKAVGNSTFDLLFGAACYPEGEGRATLRIRGRRGSGREGLEYDWQVVGVHDETSMRQWVREQIAAFLHCAPSDLTFTRLDVHVSQ